CHARTRAIAAAADDDGGAVRQFPDRYRVHPAFVAAQRLRDRGAVSQPPYPHRAYSIENLNSPRRRPHADRWIQVATEGTPCCRSGTGDHQELEQSLGVVARLKAGEDLSDASPRDRSRDNGPLSRLLAATAL